MSSFGSRTRNVLPIPSLRKNASASKALSNSGVVGFTGLDGAEPGIGLRLFAVSISFTPESVIAVAYGFFPKTPLVGGDGAFLQVVTRLRHFLSFCVDEEGEGGIFYAHRTARSCC